MLKFQRWKEIWCKIAHDHWPIKTSVNIHDDGYYSVVYICARCNKFLGWD